MPRKGERQDLTGNKYERLTVLSFHGVNGRRRQMWNCVCDCGKHTIVDATKLKSGHTKSCGCYTRDKISKLNYKNGLSNTRIAYVYRNMINRCYWVKSKQYQYYGGRGITVCDEWIGENGFVNFCNWSFENGYDMEAKRGQCTLDRIDTNKGYSPDNCRWVDLYVQANNKRNNHYIKINGEIDTVANMARKYNISYWNLLCYSKGGQNCKYPNLKIEVV